MRGSLAIALISVFVVGSFVTGTSSATAASATLSVGPGRPFLTIQSAVDAARQGDVIQVDAGTYSENVRVNGKYVDISGSPGAIIRSQSAGRAVVFFSNVPYREDLVARLAGFTITGGNASPGQGGGITIAQNASPEIVDNVVENNFAEAYGGGIAIHSGSSPTVRRNIVRGNRALAGGGGIFVALDSSPLINGNTITGNSTSGAAIPGGGSSGGGIYLENTGDASARSYPVVFGNSITGNSAEFAGGGVMIRTGASVVLEANDIGSNTASYGGGVHVESTGSSETIRRNQIHDNAAIKNAAFAGSGWGGGIALYDGSMSLIEENRIERNTASSGGGGIAAAEGTESRLTSNVVRENRTGFSDAGNQDGGGLYVANATVVAINNTFDSNQGDLGGAIALLDNARASIIHNTIVRNLEGASHGGAIFVRNSAGLTAEVVNNILTRNQGQQIFEESPRASIRNNLLAEPGSASEAGPAGLYFNYAVRSLTSASQINTRVSGASANIDSSAAFTDLNSGDLTLSARSGAIDAGTRDTQEVNTDAKRVLRGPGVVDIGAFEYRSSPIAVVQVFRFWSPSERAHFYTASESERDRTIATYPAGRWRYEAVSFNAFCTQVAGTVPLYRFYSALYRGHFYTASRAERDAVSAGYSDQEWKHEGEAFFVYPVSTSAPSREVFRFYSPQNRHHFYTQSAAERDYVMRSLSSMWTYEGANFRVPVE